jgi:phosphomannomutase
MFPIEPHVFNPSILREYDIRGLVDNTLTEKDAFYLGLGFGSILREQGGRSVCVGYDGRESSPIFAKALTAGLLKTGCNVTNIGLGPSPMVYFSVKDRGFDAGIMITGSHNPSTYNGFKMLFQNKGFYGQAIQNLGKAVAKGEYTIAVQKGREDTLNVEDIYLRRLLADFSWPKDKPLKVVWDAGNGATGNILQKIVKKLPGEHIVLFGDIDGNFPNHHPDPTVDKNLQDLIEAVKERKADLGIAFDGDGDRIGAVDENGTILRCDRLMTLYAKEVIESRPNAAIIGDVKCSQVMFDEIARLGGKPIMWNTGHSLVKAKMIEQKAPLAGELSGHIFFADHYYGFDDALYCGLRLLTILGKGDKRLSEYFTHLPELISTPELRVEVPEEDKMALAESIKNNLLKKHADSEDVSLITIDGLRYTDSNGWWLVRASNTQNCLVIRLEAFSENAMIALKNSLKSALETVGLDSNAIA